jgi:hypothetical protein
MEGTDNKNFIYQFNNKSRSAGFFMLYILSGALFLGLICIFIFTNLNLLLVITIVVSLIYFIIFHLLKPTFIELLVDESEMTINYYSVATAIKSYQSIVIEHKNFKGYEIKKRYRGIKKELILTVDLKYGLADFPPISVSGLSKKELNQLMIILSKLINYHN